MIIDRYELDELYCREEEKDECEEKEAQIKEEEALERILKTPKYV